MVCGVALGDEPSECFGTPADGHLAHGWRLPLRGENFRAYSHLGHAVGRTYVHSEVFQVVLEAYRQLGLRAPTKRYVYGETGLKKGGEFKPHKTHRNGLSVDFMVPVANGRGESVYLPTHVLNKWGYAIEFDAAGRFGDFVIDAEAMAEHLYQLDRAATVSGIAVRRVIFDPALQPLLHATRRWRYLEGKIDFSTRPSWVRHDEHYHVDFTVPCDTGEHPQR